MNVIIANKQKDMLQSLTIDVIKKMDGEYDVEELITSFKNFFFQRMILDITAIKNYKDVRNLQKLSINIDVAKIILVLDNTPESTSQEYLSRLISLGIYNFTQNIDGINYLYNNPNSYRDVAHLQQLDMTALAQPNQPSQSSPTINVFTGPKIIGFKSLNQGAGSTSLVYMLKKQLEQYMSAVAVEVDKKDFPYFMDKSLISTTSSMVGSVVSENSNKHAILIDVNNSVLAEGLCHEIYYLLQPSTIKLNRLLMNNKTIKLTDYHNKRIVLNQSLLSSKDVLDFEYESKLKVFYNLPPLDERDKNIFALHGFIQKMGFHINSGDIVKKKNKLLGIFGI